MFSLNQKVVRSDAECLGEVALPRHSNSSGWEMSLSPAEGGRGGDGNTRKAQPSHTQQHDLKLAVVIAQRGVSTGRCQAPAGGRKGQKTAAL